ncbi:hypothetical protein WJX72_001073 [[Myrmecia] bisecta]|uniref:Uncharacterized protein n=1 Tax=[Myrmecia] bisecta TaxID=41462 RepID=A0AAW1QE41_9CHLO
MVCTRTKKLALFLWAAHLHLAAAAKVPLSNADSLQGALNGLIAQPKRPEWPEEYEVAWEFAVPYVKRLQTEGLRYTYKAWQDTKNSRQKVTRDGVETAMEFAAENIMHQIYPRIDQYACRTLEIDGGKGPTRHLLQANQPELTFLLPDITGKRWVFNGTQDFNGKPAHVYRWEVKEDEGYGKVVSQYNFWVSKEGAPLQLHMWGINLYTGGHFDEWISTYTDFKAGPLAEDVWSVPDFCPKEPSVMLPQHRETGLTADLRRMLPNAHYGDEAYDAFVHKFGRRHRTHEEYQGRSQVFQDSVRLIQELNAAADSHTHGVNHFADWTRDEFEVLMLPNRGKPRPPLWPEGQQPAVHERRVAGHMLPSTLDWRHTGADSPVKDQAACGSCWAFGAIGSLEAAYFRETGRPLLLSEQHLMDCAWDTGNTACMGGFQNLAFQWVFNHSGVASEAEYPYEGVSNFCRQPKTPAASFKGKYVEVQGGELALMDALFTKGPMTVSVDAAPDSFRFYSSGVFKEPKCHSKLAKLDHAVIVSGYGTTESGEDYWLVKNTWSPFWGEEGYIRIARQPHDCGIATQPTYVELDIQS